jgi:hypothetical protein
LALWKELEPATDAAGWFNDVRFGGKVICRTPTRLVERFPTLRVVVEVRVHGVYD